jgi:hypothetical protein
MRRLFKTRTALRFATFASADYLGPNGVGTAVVENLSRDGWRLEGCHHLQPGIELTLSALLPGHAKPVKIEKAVVRWTKGHSFGIQILEMNTRQRMRQARYLSSQLQRLMR